jgi:porphobilinogen synthase
MTHFYFLGNAGFPHTRLRRNRSQAWTRHLIAETVLSSHDLILPLFVRDAGIPDQIQSLPGVCRYSLEALLPVCEQAVELGIPAVALFPVIAPEKRTPLAEELLNPEGLLLQAIRRIKQHIPELGIITDVALDVFTSHGQDGLIQDGKVLNDETLEVIQKAAVLQAQAGSDVIAPSEMMDGRIKALRACLDSAGFQEVLLLSYTAKYASAFYGPFRDAVGSTACLGLADKKTYQMDPANQLEALREAALDVEEGADMLMVKPGLPYLDIISLLKHTFPLPILAYHVSGEYAMLKAAASQGWLDGDAVLMESLLCLKRAGASAILTYGALEAAALLKQDGG